VIPVIAHSDTFSADGLSSLKENITSELDSANIQPFIFGVRTESTQHSSQPYPPYAISTAPSKDNENGCQPLNVTRLHPTTYPLRTPIPRFPPLRPRHDVLAPSLSSKEISLLARLLQSNIPASLPLSTHLLLTNTSSAHSPSRCNYLLRISQNIRPHPTRRTFRTSPPRQMGGRFATQFAKRAREIRRHCS